MTSSFCRKRALVALVILLLVLCAFFACAGEKESVSVDFTVEGELVAGSTYSFNVTYSGSKELVAEYEDKECTFESVGGSAVAVIEGNKLKIYDSAVKGASFSVRLSVGDVSVVKTFVVALSKPIAVQSVTLVCPESAEAGEVIALSADVLPEGVDALPVYTVLSGSATVEGNLLKIAEDADAGVVVVKATVAGVDSAAQTISVTTVQTRLLTLTLARSRALPGERVNFVATKEPADSNYPIEITLEKGGEFALVDNVFNALSIGEDAPLGSEITLVARSGAKEARATLTVGRPAVESIEGQGGIIPVDNTLRTIDFTVKPESADRASVVISVVEGEDLVEWTGGDTFRVIAGGDGDEITFLLESGEDVYHTVTYKIGHKELTSLTISTSDQTSYVRSGYSVAFTHTSVPENTEQTIRYRATAGADLVQIEGNVVTVKAGAEVGTVTIVAESEDGTVSNPVDVTVSGKYVRREYDSWANVSFATSGENSGVWMVLPPTMNAGSLTVVVPHNVVDLIIEGHYDGSDETAYKDLYFYFRNTAQRTVTLWNFGTIATEGLGGTVFDLGSSGETEIVLKGQNLIRADSPYALDNTGEKVDGEWKNSYTVASQKQQRRAGKPGYRGTAGGTAVSGYSLTFLGQGGTLVAEAGSGVDGTQGGKGADATYDGSLTYLSGAGGNGGNGGDSGVAVNAYYVQFLSGFVIARPGNAGVGGAGGEAGSISALAGYDVTKATGAVGVAGEDGTPCSAVKAKRISGNRYSSSVGEVKSLSARYAGSLIDLTERLSRYYGINLYYGTNLYNPYANYPRRTRYTMTKQLNAAALMLQTNFLMYTMSLMPRNCWREVKYRKGVAVTIYLCESITSGEGSTIYGLTNDQNNVWFATFDTDLRGVYYSGYFNIMLHEFVHVFHYNLSKSAKDSFESALSQKNYGLGYSSTTSTERVYGMPGYDENNSCFFTSYSRKSVMEDAAETLSIAATFSAKVAPLASDSVLRRKVLLVSEALQREYETLSPFITGKVLFGDGRIA